MIIRNGSIELNKIDDHCVDYNGQRISVEEFKVNVLATLENLTGDQFVPREECDRSHCDEDCIHIYNDVEREEYEAWKKERDLALEVKTIITDTVKELNL